MLQLNLANAYLQGGQPKAAETILNRYTFSHKDDGNGWDLLAQAEAALNNRDQELAARAESYALAGRLDQAISLLSSASAQAKLGSQATGALRCAYRPAAPVTGTLQAIHENVIAVYYPDGVTRRTHDRHD